MRLRLYFLIMLLCLTDIAFSQNISVKSFKLLNTDLTANTKGTSENDQNGETAALIKIVTTEKGFTFDCGMLGIVKTKQTPGEIWLYLPRGAQKITIKHPQLGVLRNYYFPISIEGARTYELVLTTSQIKTIVQKDVGGQYLIMHIEPTSAIVFIDNKEAIAQNGIISKFLSYGKHTYEITDPLYKPEKGEIEIGKEKKDISIELKPNYGILNISTSPENGAKVFLDEESSPIGITPFTSCKIKSGEHKFRFQLKDYESKIVSYIVSDDGGTYPFTQEMSSNFADVNIEVPDGSNLFINGELKSTGNWQGRLSEGMYLIEAQKEGFRSTSQSISVTKGKNMVVNIPELTPIYGILNINCSPIGADVYLDGNKVGETPCVINNVLIGEHELSIQHREYGRLSKKVVISENKITELNEELSKDTAIVFSDKIVENICLKKWDLNKDGVLSFDEAQKVKSLDVAFKMNTRISTFEELKYFTSLTHLDKDEFYSCSSLSSITLPNSIREIDNDAFMRCRNLTNIQIPNTISYIGSRSFAECDKLSGSFKIGEYDYDYSDNRAFLRSIDINDNYKYGYNIPKIFKITDIVRIGNDVKISIFTKTPYTYCISRDTYIQLVNDKKKYKICNVDGISYAPITTVSTGSVEFSLTFKDVPLTANEVNLIEPRVNGIELYGIRLK